MDLQKEQLKRQAYVIDKLHKKLEERFAKKVKNSQDKDETFKKKYLNKIASHIENIKIKNLQSVIKKFITDETVKKEIIPDTEIKDYKLLEIAKDISLKIVDLVESKKFLQTKEQSSSENKTFNLLKNELKDIEHFIDKFQIKEKKQVLSFVTILLSSHEVAFIAFKSMEKLLIMDIYDNEDNQTSEQNLYKIIGEDIFEHIQYRLAQENQTTVEWENDTIIEIGSEIFSVLLNVNVLEKYEKENTSSYHYKLSEEFENNSKDIFATIKKYSTPFFEPMIVSPINWTTIDDGGFIRNSENDPRYNLNLIKTTSKKDRENLALIKEQNPSELLKAINVLQKTKWKINKEVLNAIEANNHEEQQNIKEKIKIIALDTKAITKMIKDTEQELKDIDFKIQTISDTLKDVGIEEPIIIQKIEPLKKEKEQFNKKKKEHEEERKKLRKKKNKLSQDKKLQKIVIDIAKRYQEFEKIYFVWQIDFRGRAYPVQPMLNPQGDDIAKSLLHFSTKKPLGETGEKWFKIHGANLYGVDKVSFEERILWVDTNKDSILEVANSEIPFNEEFLKKADKKYQFLAFCYEYTEYIQSPSSFQSSLPIAIDGSNNGFQHITTLLKDSNGAKKVNVLSSDLDKPADIYEEVAKKSKEIAREWIESNSNQYQKVKKFKSYIENIIEKIDRNFTKKNVMTDTYGAGKKTKASQVEEYIHTMEEDLDSTTIKEISGFFALANDKAIDEIAPSSAKYKRWIKKVIKIALEKALKENQLHLHNQALVYKTPIIGLLVIQEEFKIEKRRIVTKYENKENRTQILIPTNEIDIKEIIKGIAPNFIHSLDSTHLYMTVLSCHNNGIDSFSTIHDSFATYASDIDILGKALREEFINLHKNNVLEDLCKQLLSTYNLKAQDIPKIPFVDDTFDINKIKNAEYFFA